MLVLTRKIGERIMIGEDIVLTVIDCTSGRVRLGFEGPKEVQIDREEIRRKRDDSSIS